MKKLLWFAGLYLLIGGAVLVWNRRRVDPAAAIWTLPAGGDWKAIVLWPVALFMFDPPTPGAIPDAR